MSQLIKQITEAIKMEWEKFSIEHPNQASTIVSTYDSPVETIARKLTEDAAYDRLVKQTYAEDQIANVIKAVRPLIASIIPTLL